jgi:hypothetical protein
MNELITLPADEIRAVSICQVCDRSVASDGRYCQHCGNRLDDESVVTINDNREVGELSRRSLAPALNGGTAIAALLDRRWAVIGMIALIGPLGLPALWLSPRFAKKTKVTLTTAYFLFSVVLPLAFIWYLLNYWMIDALRPLLDVLGA